MRSRDMELVKRENAYMNQRIKELETDIETTRRDYETQIDEKEKEI